MNTEATDLYPYCLQCGQTEVDCVCEEEAE
jgi:hypothetical protein